MEREKKRQINKSDIKTGKETTRNKQGMEIENDK
jgi:hypothetical protein